MTAAPVVPVAAARHLLLEAQGLLDDPDRQATPARLEALIERLGYVQLDSITAVERAHHHILWTRLAGYRPEQLARLHARGRLFEHMTHDASLIPIRWFEHWRPRFERPPASAWWRERLGKDREALVRRVLDRIVAEGPLLASDFEGKSLGGWWEWRPEKAALEYLWRSGVLAVRKRVRFQKVYDLLERVLPEAAARPAPDAGAHLDWAVGTAIERLVVASPTELAHFWRSVSPAAARGWCRAAVREGRLVAVRVADRGGVERSAFALPDWEERLARAPGAPALTRLLSPFDPVLRDRKRAARLFGFDYRFEAFVPEAKRQFGYYVLPVLEGDRLVGRVDARLDREARRLAVLGLFWEKGVRATRARKAGLDAAVARLEAQCLSGPRSADW